eukprot:362094-Chlamydomonas_euryale.AAC.10
MLAATTATMTARAPKATTTLRSPSDNFVVLLDAPKCDDDIEITGGRHMKEREASQAQSPFACPNRAESHTIGNMHADRTTA